MKKLIILQWGKNRSILKEYDSEKCFVVDNQYLMNLDEMGMIL